MRAVVQRVKAARVEIDGQVVGSIKKGLVIFLAVASADEKGDAEYLAEKIANLRIFDDEEGKINRSVKEIGGAALVVSNFTLYGDCRKGRRPGFSEVAVPEKGNALYEQCVEGLRQRSLPVATGQFQAYMQVYIQNDGPVTILLDSRKQF